MKTVTFLAMVVVAVLALPKDTYDDPRLDNVDVDALISNMRLMKSYTQCFLGKRSCTAEGKEAKKVLPEIVETVCGKCTPKQRAMIRKLVIAVRDKLPEDWKELLATFDPQNKHAADLEKFLAKA